MWNKLSGKNNYLLLVECEVFFTFVMKRKFQNWWSNLSTIINNARNHFSPQIIEHKNNHDISRWKSRSCFGTVTKCGGAKPIILFQTPCCTKNMMDLVCTSSLRRINSTRNNNRCQRVLCLVSFLTSESMSFPERQCHRFRMNLI